MSYNVLSDYFFRPPFPTQTTYYCSKGRIHGELKPSCSEWCAICSGGDYSLSVIFFVPSVLKRCDIKYATRFLVSLSSKIGVRVYLPYIDPRSFRSFDVSLLFRDTIIPKAKPKVTTAVTKAKAATTAEIITIGRTANVSE